MAGGALRMLPLEMLLRARFSFEKRTLLTPAWRRLLGTGDPDARVISSIALQSRFAAWKEARIRRGSTRSRVVASPGAIDGCHRGEVLFAVSWTLFNPIDSLFP